MTLPEFKELVAHHTQVTMRPENGRIQKRPVTEVASRGIHTLLPWGEHRKFFIDWPVKRSPHDYEIRGTRLTWLWKGREIFSYTFPLTLAQALEAAYDQDGNPRGNPA
ncbi:hypothetical protein [Streptomyces sp. NPDC001089]